MQLDDEILDKVDKITHHSGFLRNQNGFIVGFHKQFFFCVSFKCSMLVSFDVFHEYQKNVPCWFVMFGNSVAPNPWDHHFPPKKKPFGQQTTFRHSHQDDPILGDHV